MYKFLKQITPYIQHYATQQPGKMSFWLRNISAFIHGVQSHRSVVVDIYAFNGGSRDGEEDQLLEFPDFTKAFMYLIRNIEHLRDGGVEVFWADSDETEPVIFDMIWFSYDSLPISESPNPLNDFLVNQIIAHAPSLQGLALPA